MSVKFEDRYRSMVFDRWYVGLDLGQTNDPAALCVLRHWKRMLPSWKKVDAAGYSMAQESEEYFDIPHLDRIPLKTNYVVLVNQVREFLRIPPLDQHAIKLVIDETGVGRPIGDLFENAGLQPVRITITAGLEAKREPKGWHVPKSLLIANIESRQHSGELQIGKDVNDADAVKAEMQDFRRKISDAGRTSWDAKAGKHDDLIMSMAIALWEATNRTTWTREPLPFL